MQFVVDESAGVAGVEYLRGAGHDVLAIAEIMPQADERDILTLASEKRILVTNDKDFGELVFRSGLARSSTSSALPPTVRPFAAPHCLSSL